MAAGNDSGISVTPMQAAREASLHLVGHDAELETFRQAATSGRLHHAWMLTGPEGTGKAPLAFRLARFLLNAEDPDSPAGRQVTAGSHPDLLAIGRSFDEKRQKLRGEIVADEIRPVGSFLHRTAAKGGWRVVVIDTAEAMNRNAANALLKVLEEPPAGAILLLTSAMPGRLLPTIRSRVRTLPVAPLSEADIRAVLTRVDPGVPYAETERVVPLAEGSPGRALMLLGDKGGRLAECAREALHGMTAARMLAVAELAGSGEQSFQLFFMLLSSTLAEAARKAGASDLTAAARLADRRAQVCQTERNATRFNLDKQEAVIEAISILSGAG